MGKSKNNEYYLRQLEVHHPQIYADYKAGRYPTVKDARRAAGTLSERTRLHELKNAWTKASSTEKKDFVAWIKTTNPSPTAASLTQIIDPEGDHHPKVAKRIIEIQTRRGIRMGQVMSEMKFSPYDQSLSSAIKCGTSVRQGLAKPLAAWLKANENV